MLFISGFDYERRNCTAFMPPARQIESGLMLIMVILPLFWCPSHPDQSVGSAPSTAGAGVGPLLSAGGVRKPSKVLPCPQPSWLLPSDHYRFGRVWSSIKQLPTLRVNASLPSHPEIWLHVPLCSLPFLGQPMERF